ncbi:FadR/GntR family transcriptional regulator [Ornithinicoccus halotolerans]|uniref:FadR/GntR family transcriptional regulator n=1 Tax=Ornithinicoccus halotolerans TaxID=1748220 RepID=UPI001294F8A6|nr:FadR/GntR family transcriptional regulator [Ornithinicoccus halotolerans]
MSVTDEAILKIKQMIMSGELGPGDRLPPEQELSERLGLSRSSLREAVKALGMFRVLDVRRGDGTYVTSLQPSLLTEAMAFVVDLHQDRTVLELMEVRRFLEAAAARKAAPTVAAGTLEAMRAEIELARGADVESLVEHDLAFHRLLAQAAGNDYLVSLLDGLSPSTVRARVWRALTQHGAVERTIAEHESIVRALETRDPDVAEAAVVVHISGVEQWLRTTLAAQEAADARIDGADGPDGADGAATGQAERAGS